MEYIRLGSTGIKISRIVLGTMQMGWRMEEETSFKLMDKALELGINCFDTADIYSFWADNSYPGKAEEIIGRWLKNRDTRADLILATKLRGAMSDDINNQGLSRRHVHQAILGSLKRLQTDWVDLYQIHSFDPDTSIEETLHALNILVDQGIVNYLGASNLQPWQVMEALWVSDKYDYVRFEVLQPVYNLARRILVEHNFEKVITKYGLGVICYSPLAAGFLTGRYSKESEPQDTPRVGGVKKRYFTEKRLKILDTVKEISTEHDATMGQISLAWILTKPFVTAPIIGANNLEQLDNLDRLNEVSNWFDDYERIR